MAPVLRVLPARYEGVELVARGGMADVYRATDSVLGRTVAAKVLAERYAALPDFRQRFEREALTAASLTHPNVVTIFDVGECDGRPYIVMEYLAGGSLADRLHARRPIRVDMAIPWLEQAARALDAAHLAGIVHRDVKPGNLLLDSDEEVHVTDFGIARAAANDPLTATGTILGSAGYMAPEQARGERATAASDRYALACVAFELLTGRRPFVAESPTAEAMLHESEPPPHASEIEPSLPAAVDAVLVKALAKDPRARPDSAVKFVDGLRRALSEDDTRTRVISPPPPRRRDPSPGKRYRAATVLAVVLALAGAATAVALALGDIGGDEPRSAGERRPTAQATTQAQPEPPPAEPPPPVPAPPPPPPPPPEPPPAPPPAAPQADAVSTAAAANDRAYQMMLAEDFEGALPILENAYRVLAGTAVTAEAYTAYNLAFARFALGSCDGVLDLLDRSETVQGERREISRLRTRAEKHCA